MRPFRRAVEPVSVRAEASGFSDTIITGVTPIRRAW